jgi:hypothetical protein
VVPSLTGDDVLAKVLPRFQAFKVGELDSYGTVNDDDFVTVKNPAMAGNQVVGTYITQHTSAFYGAPVENNAFTVTLKSNESGTNDGFIIASSTYIYLTDTPATTNNNTGTIVWSTSAVNASGLFYLDKTHGPTFGLAEPNAFYHLNKMRRYFGLLNRNFYSGPTPVDLDSRINVMVHAAGAPDVVPYRGMENAFYDLENDYMFFGDGPRDLTSAYRPLSLDGTIVRHEYTHLAVHRIYPIINFGEFGAMSEALSDYFSLASFWYEGYAEGDNNKKNLDALGRFLGPDYSRPISGTTAKLPSAGITGTWQGELYNDSLILSQTLYSLRRGGTYDLGTIGGGGLFAGLPTSDFLVWAALFYFPDSFANLQEAILDVCTHVQDSVAPGSCDSTRRALINSAFSDHNISGGNSGDAYETSAVSGLCVNNKVRNAPPTWISPPPSRPRSTPAPTPIITRSP